MANPAGRRHFRVATGLHSSHGMSIPQLFTSHAVAAAVCILGLTAAGGKRPVADPDRPVLTFQAFGAVRLGSTVAEAEGAMGIRLTPDRDISAGECHYVQNQDELPGAAFMVLADRIVRADVYEPGPRTAEGIEVGSTEADVQVAYPSAAVESHPYLDEGHVLRVESGDGIHAMAIETDGEQVTSFRAGEREAVAFIEGCE